MGEVVKELGDARVVTVAIDDPASEMPPVMPQLPLNIRQLGVKLITLASGSRIESGIRDAHPNSEWASTQSNSLIPALHV